MPPTLPPGPSLRAAEQTIRWIGQPYAFLRECRDAFGDPFTLDLGPQGKWVLFSHPLANRAIFTGDNKVLHAGKAHVVLRQLLGKNSLLQLEEEQHLRERRLLLPPFHGRRISTYTSMIRDVARQASQAWQPGEHVVMHDVMQRISLDVMLHAVFGLEDAAFERLEDLVLRFLGDPKFNLTLLSELKQDVSDSNAWKAHWATFETINEIVLTHVAARRRSPRADETDVLSMLLAARDEDGQPMTDDELRDELVTLLVTGFETTATGLAWAFYWVHREPEVLDRLRAEIDACEGDAVRCADNAYVDAVCKETLRIYPVIPLVGRQLQRDFEVQGHVIPAGVTVSACIYLTHHRPDLYPEPDSFRPERFLTRDYSPYEWLPFGGGARRCLAMPLALLEMKVVLSTILTSWELELKNPGAIRPLRRSVAIRPSDGTTMLVRGRRTDG